MRLSPTDSPMGQTFRHLAPQHAIQRRRCAGRCVFVAADVHRGFAQQVLFLIPLSQRGSSGPDNLMTRSRRDRLRCCDTGPRCFMYTPIVPDNQGYCKDLRVKSYRSPRALRHKRNTGTGFQSEVGVIAASDGSRPMPIRPAKIRRAVRPRIRRTAKAY